MTLPEAINILKEHNKWRLGAEMPQLEPKKITEAINKVVASFKGNVKGKPISQK